MSKLLRSIIPDTRVGDQSDLMFRNYISLRESIFDFDIDTDVNIYSFIKTFASSHGHLPEQTVILDYFDSNNDFDEADKIRQISSSNPIYKGDFILEIERRVEEARHMALAEAMSKAKTIARQGIEIKEGRNKKILKGARDAGKFLSKTISNLLTPTFGSKLGGDVLNDEEAFWEYYDKVKNTEVGVLPMTGLKTLDDAIGGFRKKEMYLVAGYTGHMKSKTTMNWIYNQAIYQGLSSIYFQLEMHYEQCRETIYAFHSMHKKFRAKRLALGIQPKPNLDVGLDPVKIKKGELSEDEIEFLKEVVKDLKEGVNNGKYGSIHFEIADPDEMDITVEDIKTKAEVLHQRKPAKILVVDHALLVSSRRWVASTTERLNEVIRDLKKLSLRFNRGEGIPVLCLFQISREGFKAADKNGGTYNLTHLSYANEAERSSDVVISTWFNDEMREKNTIKYQCLKMRDGAGFDQFEAQPAWPSGRILNMPNFFGTPKSSKKSNGDALSDALGD